MARECNRCHVLEGEPHFQFCRDERAPIRYVERAGVIPATPEGEDAPKHFRVRGVAERLTDAAQVSAAKDREYGESYMSFGDFAASLFPSGLKLEAADDWARFACLFEIVQKVHRYSKSFDKGGHADSLIDISVYAQMLARLDDENRART